MADEEPMEFTPNVQNSQEHEHLTSPVREVGDRPDIGFFATSDIPATELDKMKKKQNWEVLKKHIGTNTLSLSRCDLVELPSEALRFTQLTRLYLTYNKLDALPDAFDELSSLTILNLGTNTFSKIPHVIFKLKGLKVLYLKNNKLTSDAIGTEIQKLKNLQELYLSHNALESFPRAVCGMKNLLLLTLSDNRIADIPDEISKMKKLRVLKLRSNLLKKIPDSFGELQGLEVACFAQNMIDEFPFIKVKNLHKLRDLCLFANRLTDGEALESCSRVLAERGGTFRAEENRVMISRMGGPLHGLCDGPFDVWKVDITWLYDGDESVKSWIDSHIANFGHFASKVFGPRDKEMEGVLKHTRIVCVVCTTKMCRILNSEENLVLHDSIQTLHKLNKDDVIWAVMYDRVAGVSPFMMENGLKTANIIRGYEEAFMSHIIRVINSGTRIGIPC